MADQRFAALSTDPRYRLPSRKESRTSVDPRFKRLFTDQDFSKKARVDRYGRRVKQDDGKKGLQRFYSLDKVEDPAGGNKSGKSVERQIVGSSEEEESEDGASVESAAESWESPVTSSEENSSSEEASDDEVDLAEETAGQEQTEDIPMGEVTKRIAVVNLDWDNIRARDIMAVASSFVTAGEQIESVTIYPSDFGKERMQKEELEGPPKDIFAFGDRSLENESNEAFDSDNDENIKRQLQTSQVDEGAEFDTAKLRQYQLERLRYYYAVIKCTSLSTAKGLYDSMDGREYLNTANFFDLRFIPEETSFDDDKPIDTSSALENGYKPNEFRTEALTHSKVRLTWDADDVTRKEVQKRAFSRAEMDEQDLKAYIGSDSSDDGSVTSRKDAAEERRRAKKEAERARMRAALGLSEALVAKARQDEPVGDMQITFTSGLTGGGKETKGVFENDPQDEESTRQRYIRKERERKQKRKEKSKAARGTAQEDGDEVGGADTEAPSAEQGFDDPFFNDPGAAVETEKKTHKKQKKKALAAEITDDSNAASRAELELLMADDQEDDVKHFDMREVEKAQRAARKKGKKGKKVHDNDAQATDSFAIETEDPRFKALFESHEYAIDPTNPRYKGTEGMRALLDEGRKKRKRNGNEDDQPADQITSKQSKKAPTDRAGDSEFKSLVARLGGRK